jgi:hypothetical protein
MSRRFATTRHQGVESESNMNDPVSPEPRTKRLRVEDIEVGDRLRLLDPEQVKVLAESMLDLGLLHPISVASTDSGAQATLVAGLHRLEAAKKLGWIEIDCLVLDGLDELERQLWEIDENLARSELTELEFAEHHHRRKEILVARGQVRAHGGDRRSSRQDADLKSYAEVAGEKFGVHEDTIRRHARRAERIAPDVRDEIRGTDIATSGAELDALGQLQPEVQRALVHDWKKAGEACRRVGSLRPSIRTMLRANVRTPDSPNTWSHHLIDKLASDISKILSDGDYTTIRLNNAIEAKEVIDDDVDRACLEELAVALRRLASRASAFADRIKPSEDDSVEAVDHRTTRAGERRSKKAPETISLSPEDYRQVNTPQALAQAGQLTNPAKSVEADDNGDPEADMPKFLRRA